MLSSREDKKSTLKLVHMARVWYPNSSEVTW